jgi:hypothetical protein
VAGDFLSEGNAWGRELRDPDWDPGGLWGHLFLGFVCVSMRVSETQGQRALP